MASFCNIVPLNFLRIALKPFFSTVYIVNMCV